MSENSFAYVFLRVPESRRLLNRGGLPACLRGDLLFPKKEQTSKLWDSTAISVEVCQKWLKIANKSHTCVNKHSNEQSAVLRSE